ncbi:MAG: endonuclease VII domain-containing protein [Actinomycetota bacterium]|nr:endonuclease VII domain-containing protein [Acidimicrobiia bacterium]MDQ3293047.1 endonuclease VII domain-containing protein [Actinomycetota bacterium]
MLDAQGGGCAICGAAPARLASLHLDHDHHTGAIRGILCINCNQGIGKFGEDVERLRRAAEYLAATR